MESDTHKILTEQPKIYRQELFNNLSSHLTTKIEFLVGGLQVIRLTVTKYLDNLATMGLLRKEKLCRANYYIN